MLRFRGAAFLLMSLAFGLMAGCGGGGSGSGDDPIDPPIDPPPTTTHTITGRVVSSLDPSRGVPNVVITFGSAYAISVTGGNYQLTFGTTSVLLPFYYSVDTSGAGAAYPTTELVTMADGQTYDPRQIDVPLAVLNGDTTLGATLVVREISGDSPPSPPYASKDGMVYGRVIKASTSAGVPNATIRLGNPSAPALTVTTGRNGYFAFNLGRDMQLVDVVGTNRVFSVDLRTTTGLSESLYISYGQSSDFYFQRQAIAIPSDSDNIGLITVWDLGGTTPVNPPPPPPF